MSVTRLYTPGGTSLRGALAAALQASGHLLFELDPRSGALAWPACASGGVLGHPPARLASLTAWLDIAHPEERAALRADLLDGRLETDPGQPAACFRLRNAAGEFRWIELRGTRFVARGRLADRERMVHVGTLLDVTARRPAEPSGALSDRILERIREAVAVTDRNGRIRWANAAFGTLVGLPREPLAGSELQRFQGGSEARRIEQRQEIRDAVERRGVWQGRIDARRTDGSPRITEACVSRVDDGDGDLWVHVYRDITERVTLDEASLAANRVEQQHLGVELHDSLGQELAGTSMLVRTLRNAIAAGAGVDPALLRDIESLLQSSVSRCRDLAQAVSPFIIAEQGLGAALQDLVHRARASQGIAAIRADVCARTARLDGNFGYHLYRLAQWSLSTMLAREAVASVDLQLWWEEDDRVVLAIMADGRAPPHCADSAEERLLRHRLELLGGSCEPLQASGGRTGLIAMVPVATAHLGAAPAAAAKLRAIRA